MPFASTRMITDAGEGGIKQSISRIKRNTCNQVHQTSEVWFAVMFWGCVLLSCSCADSLNLRLRPAAAVHLHQVILFAADSS